MLDVMHLAFQLVFTADFETKCYYYLFWKFFSCAQLISVFQNANWNLASRIGQSHFQAREVTEICEKLKFTEKSVKNWVSLRNLWKKKKMRNLCFFFFSQISQWISVFHRFQSPHVIENATDRSSRPDFQFAFWKTEVGCRLGCRPFRWSVSSWALFISGKVGICCGSETLKTRSVP